MKNGFDRTSGSAMMIATTIDSRNQCRGSLSAKMGKRTLDLLALSLTHEAGRTRGEYEQDDEEGDAFFQVRIHDAKELLEQTDDEPSNKDADRILEPAQDRRCERFDP